MTENGDARPIVGMSWFREDAYERTVAIMEDGHIFPPTYAGWQAKAQKQLDDAKTLGWVVYRFEIDAETFPAWCARRKLNVDAQARRLFGEEGVKRMFAH